MAKEERDWSVLVAVVLVGVPVIVFFALDYTVLPYWKSGTVEQARVIPTQAGERLFVIEEVSDGEDSSLERLSIYDPADLTKEPVQTWTREGVRFEGFAGGRLWFSSYHDEPGWHARDPLRLEVTVTQESLQSADPRLRRLHEGTFSGDALLLSTLDGYELRVDAETLAITERPKENGRYVGRRSASERDVETSYEVTLPGGGVLGFEGQPRVSIRRDKSTLGTETFLHPRFLQARRGDGPLLLDDPASVLISHRKTVEYDSPLSVSRVSLDDGRVLWTRGLGEEKKIEEAALIGDFLVLVAHESARSIFVRDGSVSALVEF